MLLHIALEEELDEKSGILRKVGDFISCYSQHLAVICNCARKSEVSTWKALFDAVGDPKYLFEVSAILELTVTRNA
jgi:hypothetical protein